MRRIETISMLFGLVLLGALGGPATAQPLFVGQDGGDHVRLLWLPESWTEDLDGFEVRRRLGGESWQPLHSDTLLPSLERGRDLRAVDASAADRNRAREEVDQLIDRGVLIGASSEEILRLFRNDQQALGLWRLHLVGRFDIALAMGFGFVDRAPAPGAEYGLFSVRSGRAADQPAALFRRGERAAGDVVTGAEVRRVAKDTLSLSWSFDARRMEQEGVAGFQAFRRAGDEWVQIGPGPFILAVGGSTAAVIDGELDTRQDAVYAVAPVDYFGDRGPLFETLWEPQQEKAPAAAPRIAKAERLDDEGGVAIGWELAGVPAVEIASFLVTRRGAGLPQTFELGPQERQFIDSEPKPSGEWYSYTVTALGARGWKRPSSAVAVYLPDIQTPPVPRGLRAQALEVDGKQVIRLQWAAPEDGITDGYVLYANSPPNRQLHRQASLGTIRGDRIDVPVYTSGPATYRFQLTAKSAGHDESERTSVVEVRAGSTALPPVQLARLIENEGTLVVSWRFPEVPDLAGFRVFIDDELAVDWDQIGADARSWSLGLVQDPVQIRVEAVTKGGVTKRSFAKTFKPRRR